MVNWAEILVWGASAQWQQRMFKQLMEHAMPMDSVSPFALTLRF
jgi:hypothetical protein